MTQSLSYFIRQRRESEAHLRIVNRSGRHLLTLINDILDMAKIESGRMYPGL